MTDTLEPILPKVASRKRNAEATRDAILSAAKAQFAQLGYDRALLRDIAGAAGVDASLVKRYFGGKEALFREALRASFLPDWLREWDRATFGRELATMMAKGAQGDEERTLRFQFLLRAATSPTTLPILNDIVRDLFLEPIREWLGGRDAKARARVLAATYIGLMVERLIRGDPLSGRERTAFIASVTSILAALVADPNQPGA